MIRFLLALPLCLAAPNPQVRGGGDIIPRRPYLDQVFSPINWRKEGKNSTIYMTSTGNLTTLEKFKLVSWTSPMQPNFPRDILSSSQGKGTVLPEAWLPHQIARRHFFLHWTSLIY